MVIKSTKQFFYYEYFLSWLLLRIKPPFFPFNKYLLKYWALFCGEYKPSEVYGTFILYTFQATKLIYDWKIIVMQVLVGPLLFIWVVIRATESIILMLMVVMTKNSRFVILFTFSIFQIFISFYPQSEEVDNADKILFLLIKI